MYSIVCLYKIISGIDYSYLSINDLYGITVKIKKNASRCETFKDTYNLQLIINSKENME